MPSNTSNKITSKMYSLPALICTLTLIGLGGIDGKPQGGYYYGMGMGVDTTNPVNVLKAQMDDMQAGTTRVTYQLASPANRMATAGGGYDYMQFDRMVRSPMYMPLLSGNGYKVVGNGPMGDNQYYADVKVMRARGGSSTYRFIMSKQYGNVVDQDMSLGAYRLMPGHKTVWRTDSVYMMY